MSCIYTIKGIVQVHISASFWCPDALEDGQKKIIADRYGKGATMAELADQYGVGVGTIHRALRPFLASAAA